MLHVSCSKFSQLSNSEKNENLSTIDKVTVCNAMSSFLDHPVEWKKSFKWPGTQTPQAAYFSALRTPIWWWRAR